jgi:predicted nuclease of predicted toxin-antitoxin system
LRKPSDAKPRELVFFIDRSLGRIHVANALRALGYRCELHDDHFDQDTPDSVWLAELAEQDWVVITKDARIRHRPLEQQALQSSGLRVFVITSGNLTGVATAELLVRAIGKITRVLEQQTGPFIYHVRRDSSVKRMF